MASVGVVDVRKSYGAQEIIHGVSIDIQDGEFVILVGPSGCGKSTLLRMIAFAVNPADGEVVVIEMNPRVSRSSALASKATGFPIAKIAARLAVGYALEEIPNDISGAPRRRSSPRSTTRS